MLQRTLIILLAFYSLDIYSQDKSYKIFEKGDIQLTLSPLNILYFEMPSLDIGVSYFISNRIEAQLKFGQKIDVHNFEDDHRYNGFKVLVEGQYHLKRNLYVSIEFGKHKNNFHDKMEYLTSNTDTIGIQDTYSVRDQRITVVPKMGYSLFITKHLIVDFYGGIGVQKLLRNVNELEYDESLGYSDPALYEWFGPTYIERNDFDVWLSCGVNINWRF